MDCVLERGGPKKTFSLEMTLSRDLLWYESKFLNFSGVLKTSQYTGPAKVASSQVVNMHSVQEERTQGSHPQTPHVTTDVNVVVFAMRRSSEP